MARRGLPAIPVRLAASYQPEAAGRRIMLTRRSRPDSGHLDPVSDRQSIAALQGPVMRATTFAR